jgi:hypothetical protein
MLRSDSETMKTYAVALRFALLLAMHLSIMSTIPIDTAAQSEGQDCADSELVGQWLQVVIPIYWEHHSYVSYPPEIDWANHRFLIDWAAEQDPAAMAQQRDDFERLAAALNTFGFPASQFPGTFYLQQVLTTTADILNELLVPSFDHESVLSIELEKLESHVSATDLAILSVVDCMNEVIQGEVPGDLACFDSMSAYHGDWAKEYGGGTIYFAALAIDAEEALNNGDLVKLREIVSDIRDAIAEILPEEAPVPVQDLVKVSNSSYRAYADWLEARANLIEGIVSQETVDKLQVEVNSAFEGVETETRKILLPCEQIANNLIDPSNFSSGETTESQTPGSDSELARCDNASAWFAETMGALARANEFSDRLLQNLNLVVETQDLRFLALEDYDSIARAFEQFSTDQRELMVPLTAADANEVISNRYEHLSNAALHLGSGQPNRDTLTSALVETSTAKQLGSSAVSLIGDVVAECGLAMDATLALELSCFATTETRASEWYQVATEGLLEFVAIENEFWNQSETGVPDPSLATTLREQSDQLQVGLEQLQPPASSGPYVSAVVVYVTTASELVQAYSRSSNPEDYAFELIAYERAYEALTVAETELLSGCDALLTSALIRTES